MIQRGQIPRFIINVHPHVVGPGYSKVTECLARNSDAGAITLRNGQKYRIIVETGEFPNVNRDDGSRRGTLVR